MNHPHPTLGCECRYDSRTGSYRPPPLRGRGVFLLVKKLNQKEEGEEHEVNRR
jgi:hypothetical protein